MAEDWLGNVLDEARRGTLPGMVQTGATFADAAAEWLRYVEQDRLRKPSTIAMLADHAGFSPTFPRRDGSTYEVRSKLQLNGSNQPCDVSRCPFGGECVESVELSLEHE